MCDNGRRQPFEVGARTKQQVQWQLVYECIHGSVALLFYMVAELKQLGVYVQANPLHEQESEKHHATAPDALKHYVISPCALKHLFSESGAN